MQSQAVQTIFYYNKFEKPAGFKNPKNLEELAQFIAQFKDANKTERSALFHLYQGKIFTRQAKFFEARREFQKAIAKDSTNENIYLAKGKLYLQVNKAKHSLLQFLKALKLVKNKAKPNDFKIAKIHYFIGRAHKSLGNFQAATNYFKNAIDIFKINNCLEGSTINKIIKHSTVIYKLTHNDIHFINLNKM